MEPAAQEATPPEYVSLVEAGVILGLHLRDIRRMIDRGDLTRHGYGVNADQVTRMLPQLIEAREARAAEIEANVAETELRLAQKQAQGDQLVPQRQRHPVVRVGPRDPIPTDVRRAVYKRDGYRCEYCGASFDEDWLVLDHVMPWSAGGADTTDNLRTLCWDCNEHRSNRIDPYDCRPRPCSWWCLDCYGYDTPEWRRMRLSARDWLRTPPGEAVEWFGGIPRVYCAWCDAAGYSDWVL